MNPYDNEALTTAAVSVTDASIAIVLALSALFMLAPLDVEVTGGGRDGWLELGPVSPGERHDFASVVDQGERWVFHVTSGSHDGGEFSMSRAELARARWQVTIPPTVQSRLDGNGAVPRPRT